MAVFANPNIVEDGLVLYLDAGNERSYPGSGTNWKDLSPIGGNGVINNSPSFSSGSFNFDGASDYVRFTRDDLNGGSFSYGEITCQMWYKPSSNGGAGSTANNLITVENSFEISVGNLGNGFHNIAYASNPWAWRYNNQPFLPNSLWSLITFVHASVGRQIYVNENVVFTSNDSGLIAAGNTSHPYLTLMGRYAGTGSPAEGDLALAKLYNRALNPEEIKQNYNALRGRFGL
jgi:hypothetical protein